MFKIEHTNKHGSFSVELNRPVSCETMQQLALIAHNILTDEAAKNAQDAEDGGMNQEQQETLLSHIRRQTTLGEQPTTKMNLGSYQEPEKGVRIRMVSMPPEPRMEVVRAFREITGISILSSKDILYGNIASPLFTLDVAHRIMRRFKEMNVYAALVSPDAITGPLDRSEISAYNRGTGS